MAELLLEEMMLEILLRLPIKTLARCRRVCRRWRDLIDSRYFAKSHSNSPPSLLMLHNLPVSNAYDVVDLSSVRNGGSSPLAFKQLPVPGDGEIQYYVGNCNGLVCIADDTFVLVWNPATGKQLRFGLPPQESSRLWDWGFGYDKASDDYKVVGLETAEEDGGRCLVWVYSLRSRSWERIDDFPYSWVYPINPGVFVGGALHWIVHQRESNGPSICALHLGKLEYSLVPKPDHNFDYSGKHLDYLGVLNGCLCVMYYSCDRFEIDFDLWTMKEYGVKESWTKLSITGCSRTRRDLVPLAYFEDEEVLLFHVYNHSPFCNELLGYEFRTRSLGRQYEFKTGSSEKLNGRDWSFGSYVYAASLVSPQIGI